MSKFDLLTLSVGLLMPLFVSVTAHAQATRTWVSGVGDDVNPCSRTAPCKTFAGAISKTAAGGEISVLDPGGFGAVTITKSISIVSDGGSGEAGVLASGVNGITINAGPADVVNLRGLVIDGAGVTQGLIGIRFLAGSTLHVQNCVIKNFVGTAGIAFTPNSTAQLYVSDTVITNNGVGPTGGGILVANLNAGANPVLAVINRVQVNGNNGFGIKFDGTTGTGQINGTVRDSVSAGNSSNGIWATTPAAGVLVSINNSAALNNAGTGVLSNGVALVLMNNIVASGNTTGVGFTGGGTLLSYHNNSIDANKVTNGAPSSTLPAE
jgi:hypothetical protein